MRFARFIKRTAKYLVSYIRSHPWRLALAVVGCLLLGLGVFAFLGGPAGIKEMMDRSEKVSIEELKAREDIQVLTHFPADFQEFFGDFDSILAQHKLAQETGEHVTVFPFFFYHDPLNKGMGGRRWSYADPRISPDVDHIEELGFSVNEWPSYFMADVTITDDDISVWYDRHTREWDYRRLKDVDPDIMLSKTINGETVYLAELMLNINEHVRYGTSKSWIRASVINEVMTQGQASFPAGMIYGYGESSIGMEDSRLESGPYPNSTNPFDYFTEEKQQELLDLLEPWREFWQEQGVYPFADITQSAQWWDEADRLNGVWMNSNMPLIHEQEEAEWRQFIGVVGPEYISLDTYRRVWEHPWNQARNPIGMYIENDVAHSLFLLEGDNSAGVAMAIDAMDTIAWNPLEPDSDTNHPSLGRSFYLRYEVSQHQDMWQQQLTVEKFDSRAAANGGFTERSVNYQRGFHYE